MLKDKVFPNALVLAYYRAVPMNVSWERLARGQITALTRIVMKTIILPSGNAFGVDDNDGLPTAKATEPQPKRCSWCGSL
jgi:hypothetical protein